MPYSLRLSNDEKAKPVEFLSLGELADLCGKSKEALKKLTERGILPEANFRSPKSLIKKGHKKGQYIPGYRLYSKEFLAPKIAEFVKSKVSRGKLITLEQRAELMIMFQQEREHFKI